MMGDSPDAGYVNLIKDFSGSYPHGTQVNEFLNSVSEIGEVAQWDEATKMRIAKLRMTGRARLFRESSTALNDATTWADFCKIFKARFGNKDPKAVHMNKFYACTQHENESIADFATRLSVLCNKAHPAPVGESNAARTARLALMAEISLVRFTVGLLDPRIKRHINDAEFDEFDDAVDKAVKMEGSEKLFSEDKDSETALINVTSTLTAPKKGLRIDFNKLKLEAQSEKGSGQVEDGEGVDLEGAAFQPPKKNFQANIQGRFNNNNGGGQQWQGNWAERNQGGPSGAQGQQRHQQGPLSGDNSGNNGGAVFGPPRGNFQGNGQARFGNNNGGQQWRANGSWRAQGGNNDYRFQQRDNQQFNNGRPNYNNAGWRNNSQGNARDSSRGNWQNQNGRGPWRAGQEGRDGCDFCGDQNHVVRGCLKAMRANKNGPLNG